MRRDCGRRGSVFGRRLGLERAVGLIGLAVVALASPVGLATARAGTYVMRNCDVPGYPNSLLGPWHTMEMAPNALMVDACSSGGGVGFTFTSGVIPPGVGAVLALQKPTLGPQAQVRLVKAGLWYAVRLAGTGPALNFASLVVSSASTFRHGVSNGPPGAENLVLEEVFDPGQTTLYKVFLICGPPDGPAATENCVPNSPMPFLIRGLEVTLAEDVQPTVQQPTGTLLSGAPQSGIRTVSYSASDPQSGLARIEARVDDSVVASRDLTPQCLYTDFTVCPVADTGVLDVDTRAVPNGSHRFTLRVVDAAGNEQLVNAAAAVDVANSATSASGSATLSLAAAFKGSSRAALTVPYGRAAMIRGHLSGGPSLGPRGAQLELFQRDARRGAREVTAGRIQTRSDGSFRYVLAAHRPSRTIRVEYRPNGATQAASRSLKLRVRAASSLHASLAGLIIRFGGQVRSRPIPVRGKSVRLEGKAPGSSWTAFANVRTDGRGRFGGSYRLRIRRPGVRLKIRAVLPRQRGYPYLTYRTRPVTLRVH